MQQGAEVILELKFTDRFPSFYQQVVQTFNLRRCSAAKYCQVTRSAAESSPWGRDIPGGVVGPTTPGPVTSRARSSDGVRE